MKLFVNIILGIGILFFGGLFISALGLYLAHNEPFEIFTFKETVSSSYEISKSNNENINVSFKYSVDGKDYNKNIIIYKNLFYEQVSRNAKVLYIVYNEDFPSVSYIKNLKMVRKYQTGIVFSGLILFFLLLFMFYGKKESWLASYRRFYEEKL